MTTAKQILRMLGIMYPERHDDVEIGIDHSMKQVVNIRLHDDVEVGKHIEAVNECGIDPMFLCVRNYFGHFTLTVCDFDYKTVSDFDEEGKEGAA